ncbi:zinc transporter zip1 [Echinococcus multilocularis]|uniref:Zinc transporter zip1 n=1 Tax=Echinococcus multilocularis TaxID=6211 RepID=A0A068YKM2_ECHMU|nr:zinc transporter zip1 [Echinococcus multilocularis]
MLFHPFHIRLLMGQHDYWLLAWTLLLSLCSERCVMGDLAIYTYSGNSTGSPDAVSDGHRLTYVKLGVAVGMFSITATACALPLLVMMCIARRMHSRTSSVTITSSGPHSGDTVANRASRMNGREASSPTFLLDPQSTESEELLLTRSPDSQALEPPQTSNLCAPFYEVEPQADNPILREDHRLHWGDGAMENGAADDGVVEVFNSSAIANGGIPPSMAINRTRRSSSYKRMCVIRKWASRINCFAAGIFLSTGLMDLFPEVQDAMAVALSALKINSQYPFPALFTLLGFFMVLSMEQCVHICHNRRRCHPPYYRRSNATSAVGTHQHHNHSHDPQIIPGSDVAEGAPSAFRIMLLLIALSVHSIFEGLAVGLQRSVAEVITLFSALILHKIIMAISTGVSLATAHKEREGGIARSQWMGALFFALASPIGVLIGWALIAQRSSPALLMVVAVLQGLACGTFFFVVFCEMLPHEFSGSESDTPDRLGKIFSLVLGFVLTATYIAFEAE